MYGNAIMVCLARSSGVEVYVMENVLLRNAAMSEIGSMVPLVDKT